MIKVSSKITDMTEYIIAANSLVTEHCSELSDAQAAVVETWLAAHFVCMVDERAESTAAKGVSKNLATKIDLGLNQTKYGQTAMALDTTGGLATWQKRVMDGKAGQSRAFMWVGTDPNE
jgi:hypothetical protein